MAVYDGFFDAVVDEETGEFDRSYSSGDFTDYFAHIIGSGVCIHNNQDSFKVRFENGAAVVSPGYLFIEGYWLKNDEDYTISATGDATLAIVAHLNLGGRMIELEAWSVAQAYPDSLVLALVNPAAGTAEDTRHNTDICGTIDTAGELTKKVEWALNYIDNEIEDKLAAAEADIAEQSKRLDSKIAEVQAQVDKIAPPPIGSIKFSASEDVGPGWLPCNGDFISESQYPELVSALGKLTPSGDKFKLISDGEIGTQISNGVLYNGRMWVYSYSTQKLYGVDVAGNEPIKEITITSENEHINDFVLPTTNNPICLSVVPHLIGTGAKLFLTQLLLGRPYGDDYEWMKGALIFQADFSGEESSISLSPPFQSVASYVNDTYVTKKCIPYVVSNIKDGKELYHCAVSFYTTVPSGTYHYIEIEWGLDVEAANKSVTSGPTAGYTYDMQRVCFSKKNKGELVSLATSSTSTSGSPNQYRINSGPNNIFSSSFTGGLYKIDATAKSELPVNIAGKNYVISLFTLTNLPIFSHTEPFSKAVSHGIQLPSSARIFIDAGAYLWGKDIYMIFVGTGIIFSRTLQPMISADGVPAWIKAIGENDDQNITDPVDMKITVSRVSQYANIIFNGDALYTTGTYTRKVSESGTFTVGLRTVKADNVGGNIALKLNGTVILNMSFNGTAGLEKTVTLKTSDYISGGITLSA